MRQNRQIPELKARMALVAKAHKIERQSDWLEILGLTNPSSISRMLTTGKISDDSIQAICSQANMSEADFLGPLSELGSKLGLSQPVIATVLKGNGSTEDRITSKDAKILGTISGRYVMVYASRELHDHDLEFTTVEELILDASNASEGFFSVRQVNNLVTKNSASGSGKCRSERISMQLSYEGTEYPDSQILIAPLVSIPGNNIFSGIYMDINNIHQIWATQIVMFQVDNVFVMPRRFEANSELHEIWKPTLENRLGDRHRLIARGGDDYLYAVRAAVKKTKSG